MTPAEVIEWTLTWAFVVCVGGLVLAGSVAGFYALMKEIKQ